MSAVGSTPVFDAGVAHGFLASIYAGLPGLIQICSSDNNWTGAFFDTSPAGIAESVNYAAHCDQRKPKGVYFRTTTLTQRPASGRGGADLTCAVPILWADLDYGTEGHAPGKGELPLPPTQEDAHGLIAAAGLPEPTHLVHSGGGWYPFFAVQGTTDLDHAAALSENVQAVLLDASLARGWTYGDGVGDLARILRLPGSINRKTDNPRPCRVIAVTGRLYAPSDFPVPAPKPKAAPPARPSNGTPVGNSPLDAFAGAASWADILEPEGWTFVGTKPDYDSWKRPGDSSSEDSAHAYENSLVVWSESVGLPTGQRQNLTKARVFAHLHHGGDVSAATKDLIEAAQETGGTDAALNLPEPVLAAIRQACPTEEDRFGAMGIDLSRARLAAPVPPRALTHYEGDGMTPPNEDAPNEGSGGRLLELRPGRDTDAETDQAPSAALPLQWFDDLAAEVDNAPPRQWLIRNIWPAGDYGVMAAAPKAQKTWTALDLAVSVATGTPWLGYKPVDVTGPVIVFVGEGGKGNTVRRIRALAKSKGASSSGLQIAVCARAPHLKVPQHLAEIEGMVREHKPALVVIDPLYLAMAGASMTSLVEVGQLLEGPQRVCQAHGAALMLVHHFNRKQGSGAERSSGAGPQEWGRVLLSIDVKARKDGEHPGESHVITAMEVQGGEVEDQYLRIARRIWADDPDDLTSPMNVITEVSTVAPEEVESEGEQPAVKLAPADGKVLDGLARCGGAPASVKTITDRVADIHGHGLQRTTVSRALKKFFELGYVAHQDAPGPTVGGGSPEKLWSLTPPGQKLQNSRSTPVFSDPEGGATAFRNAADQRSCAGGRNTGAQNPRSSRVTSVPEHSEHWVARGRVTSVPSPIERDGTLERCSATEHSEGLEHSSPPPADPTEAPPAAAQPDPSPAPRAWPFPTPAPARPADPSPGPTRLDPSPSYTSEVPPAGETREQIIARLTGTAS
ncbi:AAA family ATPase [Pseudonocardia sp. Cha107L01]|uniref:AAA family ATPase n=1 Tax=Pseudonocardia sp. Cha107L01 TaxID=3457576 RepID=UPI00403EF5B4